MSPTASPVVEAEASIDVNVAAGATSGALLVVLVVAAALLVLGRRSNLHHKHTIAEFEQQHRPAMQTNPVYSSTGAAYGVPFELQHDHASSDQPIALATQTTYDVVEQSGTYQVPVEPLFADSFAETSESAATHTLVNANVSSDGSVLQAASPLYAVPSEGAGDGASPGIVQVDSLAKVGYRTLDQKGAYSSPRPQNEGLYSALATTAAVAGTAYAIPSEGGSVVVCGAETLESGENEQYLEVEGAAVGAAYSIPSEDGSLVIHRATAPESGENEQYLEVGCPPAEDEISTSVPATAAQDVPFVPTADGIYDTGTVTRAGFVVQGEVEHQQALVGAAREADTVA